MQPSGGAQRTSKGGRAGVTAEVKKAAFRLGSHTSLPLELAGSSVSCPWRRAGERATVARAAYLDLSLSGGQSQAQPELSLCVRWGRELKLLKKDRVDLQG
ncbi:hypothetical protein CapIbe_001618 [Capra ibex]